MTQVRLASSASAASAELFENARKVIPGGVNSPARSFKGVGGTPRFIARARGAVLTDVDGNDFVDYVCSWGALLLGHAHPAVVDAVGAAAHLGTSFGAPTANEVTFAESICDRVAAVDSVRLTSSGTEATMTAIRLARGYTERKYIVRFDGCYHGHADALLAGLDTTPVTGIPEELAQLTVVAGYNDMDSVRRLFSLHGKQIAAVIVEPVAANMGVVPPHADFHRGLREVTAAHGTLLIHDEVITGFRVSPAGYFGVAGVTPDLFTFGKVIGGGLPVGAVAGRRAVMEHLAPQGSVFHAGTLSGNPLAVAAGLATLQHADSSVYEHLDRQATDLTSLLRDQLTAAGIPHQINSVNGLFSLHFTDLPLVDYASASKQSTETYSAFFHAMLDHGVYLPPSPYEAWFLSASHTDETLERTAAALAAAIPAAREPESS